ncbi:MAG TPA: MarR family winged helix-turn-helix transcriptional regulator [Roseiarcus sp.]|nr:MarR family winged helix-turn-helix transcriptional regulator [Roseiarcus sp.]
MSEASVTVPQAILMNYAMTIPRSTPSSLADILGISLSSISQMVDRLVRLGFLNRHEDEMDRRRKTIEVTPKAKAFLDQLRMLRADEFVAGAAALTSETRNLLKTAIARALREFESH